MVRVSNYYQLERTQPALDFVDVDVHTDIEVFVDPSTLRVLPGYWGEQCQVMLTTFFIAVLEAIERDDRKKLYSLLGNLGEPNETHLGYSRGRSRVEVLGLLPEKVSRKPLAQAAQSRPGC